MALAAQCLQDFRFDARFNHNVTAQFAAGNSKAGRLERSLQVHAVIHEVGDKLGMGKWLVGAAHDSEADVQLSSLHEGGNDGMEGALAWRQCIGVLCIEREQSSSILQCEAHTLDNNTRAESEIVALDEG